MKIHLHLSALLLSVSVYAQTTAFTYQGRVAVNGTNFTGAGQFKFALVTSINLNHQAMATATRSGQFITLVNVTSGGNGYISAPAVTISGGGGSGATAQAIISGGVVTSVTVNNPGSGYTSTPTVTIAPPSANIVYTTYWSNDGTSVDGSEPTAAVNVAVTNGLFTVVLGDTAVANMTAIDAALFSQPNLQLRIWFNNGVNGFAALNPAQNLTPTPYAIKSSTAEIANTVAAGAIGNAQLAPGSVGNAQLAAGAVGSTQLAAGAVAANLNASGQAGVASGGLVLSANANNTALVTSGYSKIGATVTVNDGWFAGSTIGAPTAREEHTAVWTGSQMIVWGGYAGGFYFNHGGRYDPTANNWIALSALGAPVARLLHTAVWTGSQMIIWGGHTDTNGELDELDDGGLYNPVANSWTDITTSGAPPARHHHKAVWTGSQMIVWGGTSYGAFLNSGGRYNPVANSWSAVNTSGAPSPRSGHTAIWTGSQMIIWGGYDQGLNYFNNGGIYNPANNSWTPISTVGAPAGRTGHTAVWSGSQMIVWGGFVNGSPVNDGGRYDPVSNTWITITTVGAPSVGGWRPAIWTGSRVVVWGGPSDSGIYDPVANSWTTVSAISAPSGRRAQTAVWTGSQLIVWGGFEGGYPNDISLWTPAQAMFLYQKQ